jgi:phosphate transport system ATP-binding protein
MNLAAPRVPPHARPRVQTLSEAARTSHGTSITAGAEADAPPKMRVEDLHAWFGTEEVLKGITLPIADRRATAIIGPSGCGKSTFIRCLNRMHEVVRDARVRGRVLLDGQDVYADKVNPVRLRQLVGMVFQKPNPFPAMSIRENVLAGLRLQKTRGGEEDDRVERALRRAALWDEVKDVLSRSGASLSGGQQQRLCIARALALEPRVLLMDEPCSALDPIATAKIEDLIHELRQDYTVAIVTHNMQQASRVADFTAFLYLGELIEFGPTNTLFTHPADPRTEAYITGRFG